MKKQTKSANKCIYNILGSNPNASMISNTVSVKTSHSKSSSPISKPMTRTRIKVNAHRKISGK